MKKAWFNRREFCRLMKVSQATHEVAGLHKLICKIVDAGESFKTSQLSEAELRLVKFEAERVLEKAKKEWTTERCYIKRGLMDSCELCDHDIREVFVIRNTRNAVRLRVGNVCITEYLYIDGIMIKEEVEQILRKFSRAARKRLRQEEFAEKYPHFKDELIDILDNLCEYDPTNPQIKKMHANAMKDIDIIFRRYKENRYLTKKSYKKFEGIRKLLTEMREMRDRK